MKKKNVMLVMMAFMMLVGNAEALAGSEIQGVNHPVRPTSVTISQATYLLTADAAEVVADVNAERVKHGLKSLNVDPRLTAAAQVRAQEIVQKFSHTRPDGTKWSTVSKLVYGENIAKGHSTAYRVMAAWMSSAGHRQNILRASFGSIGVSALKIDGVVYWVQLFGR